MFCTITLQLFIVVTKVHRAHPSFLYLTDLDGLVPEENKINSFISISAYVSENNFSSLLNYVLKLRQLLVVSKSTV